MATVRLLWNASVCGIIVGTIISQLTRSEDTLVVAEPSLETMLSPLQNCSEGGLVKAELNYDATTTNYFA